MLFSLSHSRPVNYKELFNLCHASARNVVEQIFGVAKKRFRMLQETGRYPIETQSLMVAAMALLHSFIRIYDPDDVLMPWESGNEVGNGRGMKEHGISSNEVSRANKKRDEIAKSMWNDYQKYLSN